MASENGIKLVELLKETATEMGKMLPTPLEFEEWLDIYADQLIANGVVPVVRCKNCCYSNYDKDLDDCSVCHYGVGRSTSANDYCSHGERRFENSE